MYKIHILLLTSDSPNVISVFMGNINVNKYITHSFVKQKKTSGF